jgi:hypothetical protein
MAKRIPDILNEINTDPKLLTTTYANNTALKILFTHAFVPEAKFKLPETDPPYKEDQAHESMPATNLYTELRRLYIFTREDLPKIRRESLFIQLLEGVAKDEAKMLLAVKNQELHKLYKKITKKALIEAGYINEPKQNSDNSK